MKRGIVLGLTPEQVVARARYLASEECATIYYRLKGYNGGKDPTAADPADRWTAKGKKTVNVTCDCAGAAAWCSGYDRYQPDRFAHIYGGWINTDSMIIDASTDARCFVALDRPTPGAMIVCRSGSRGHRIGHVGVIVEVPAEWDPNERECWEAIVVVDVAGRKGRANMQTTGRGWFRTGAMFLRTIMQPG